MRKLLFRLAALLLIYACIELASTAILSLGIGTFAHPSALSARRGELAQPGGAAHLAEAKFEAVHPYLGFTLDPDHNNPSLTDFHRGQPISEWGFLDSAPPLRQRHEDTLIVGIFGGSVAYWFSVEAIDTLTARLGEIQAFAGREVSVVRVALGGYKQPQLLLALSYLLSAGAAFDVVINLDGFNEIVLPPADIAQGVFPLYPRNWRVRVEATPSHQRLALMGTISLLRGRRSRLAALAEARPLRWSMTANLLWWLSDRRTVHQMAQRQLDLMESNEQGDGRSFRTLGPLRSYATPEEMYIDLAASWRSSSLQMHHLAVANGARYWHFLQPNQYLPGSKPMEESERELAVSPHSPYAEHVAAGYPHLREAGRELAEAGVAFHDLTQLFAEESRVLYADNCCHFNRLGNELLGKEVARRIGEDMRKAQEAP